MRYPVHQLDEKARLPLLAGAAEKPASPRSYADPYQALQHDTLKRAVGLLGGVDVIGRAVASETDLLQVLLSGFPSQVLSFLSAAGYPDSVLERFVAGHDASRRQRHGQHRLTRIESDGAWRLAHVLALAEHVLSGPEAAIAWLKRPKSEFSGKTAIDLLETSVGTKMVEEMLWRLEWGDVA